MQRGLRGSGRHREARPLRPLRTRWSFQRSGRQRRRIRHHRVHRFPGHLRRPLVRRHVRRQGGRAVRARSAAPTCAKTSRWSSRKPSSASPSRCRSGGSKIASSARERRGSGQSAHQLHHLRRPRTGALSAGLLLHGAHLQHLQRFGQADRRSLQPVPRARDASRASARSR